MTTLTPIGYPIGYPIGFSSGHASGSVSGSVSLISARIDPLVTHHPYVSTGGRPSPHGWAADAAGIGGGL